MRCGERAEKRHESRARLRGKGEAAQLGITGLREPGHEAPAACGAQRLLGGPERIPAAWRAYYGKVAEVYASGCQSWGIGNMRRRKPGDALSPAGKAGERRQKKLQFPNAFHVGEDLGEHAGRPASARQFRIERNEPRGDRGHWS